MVRVLDSRQSFHRDHLQPVHFNQSFSQTLFEDYGRVLVDVLHGHANAKSVSAYEALSGAVDAHIRI